MDGPTNAWLAIMAGGIGSRFWPASRPDRPKQLLSFGPGARTLLREAVNRGATIAGRNRTLIVTSKSLQDPVCAHIDLLPLENILAEPAKRNTLGAILYTTAAVLAMNDGGGDPVIGILPADHHIGTPAVFAEDVSRAIEIARDSDALVTIGIPPTRPETGYGYIETVNRNDSVTDVASFQEKPDAATARQFLRQGRFLWNSGMFFWRFSTFMDELRRSNPEIAETAEKLFHAYAGGDAEAICSLFAELPDISIDYALMEQAKNVKVVTANFEWDDLGSWDSLPRVREVDENGNVLVGSVVVTNCRGCVVYNEQTYPIAVMGLNEMVVAVGQRGILVTPIKQAQNVRELSSSARDIIADAKAAEKKSYRQDLGASG